MDLGGVLKWPLRCSRTAVMPALLVSSGVCGLGMKISGLQARGPELPKGLLGQDSSSLPAVLEAEVDDDPL
jgi:hypothetical protein